ncbi:hypothetical protein AX279_09775 [Pseudomonas sp. J237]|nr:MULTISPECIES: UPF0149 family protein [Pseudomonas]OEO26137.1 hypothetical protein AX279_09775 [Pseudomonas sp. J237]
MQNAPLAANDYEFLEDALLKYGDDNSVLNVSELDGYLTALASGPIQVDIAEWFPAIWGGENPDWQSPDEAKQFIDLSVRHLNTLAAQLGTDVQAFEPRFETTDHHGQSVTLAEEWCFGYLRGISVSNWPELPAQQAAQLELIAQCAEEDNFELPANFDADQHNQQLAAIKPAAIALHDYWVTQR